MGASGTAGALPRQFNGRSDSTHGDQRGQQLGARQEPPCHVTELRGGDKRGSARPAPPGPGACAPCGALKFKFERPGSATEPALRAEPTGCGRACRPASCLPPELRRARTHFFPPPEFEPPDPPSRLPHVRPGAMDPFTEVRDSAGAVNHDPRTPARAACQPAAHRRAARRVRTASVQPGGSRGVAGRLPGFAALWLPRRRQDGFRLWGKAGKTGPQKPRAGRELLPPPPKCERRALWRAPTLRFPVTESALPSFLRPAFSRERAACGRLGPVLPESWNSWQGGVCPVTRTVCWESDGR